ncbi:MAG: hypothetical protein SAJ37_17995 [Oscillatoria sp. PMC 1068.18]|nr:hypothetical protein [Oscillatoria sp. PMC 1076.18]MEC4990627.1 hypothetical protein [Oscillatoria sp. PMC 1068.18]
MVAIEEAFAETKDNWDLERLDNDLTFVKQEFGKRRKLTELEKACLRGLLCGCGPNEIAAEINREPRGLRVDLSRGLYRYVEILTKQPLNKLRDWRDVADWLEKAGYKLSVSNLARLEDDSLIKIVDVSICGSNQAPVLDVKVRNVGSQVAFLKKIYLEICEIWFLQCCLFDDELVPEVSAAPQISRARSRQVEPSGYYDVDLSSLNKYQANLFSQAKFGDSELISYHQILDISQCVANNDVDRFFLALSVADLNLRQDISAFYKSFVYELKLTLIYDEDNKCALSYPLIIWLTPECPPEKKQHFFAEDFSPEIEIEKYVPEYQKISLSNHKVLGELARKEGVKSVDLQELIHRQQQLVDLEKLTEMKENSRSTKLFSSSRLLGKEIISKLKG